MDYDDAPEKEQRRKGPDALFEQLARWIGVAIVGAGMYYELELEREVSNIIFGIGGVLAGAGSIIKQLKP